jgi:hypothetical protein
VGPRLWLRKSLGTSDRAQRLGNELVAGWLTQGKAREQGAPTLGERCARFSRECATWLDNAPLTGWDDEARALVLLSQFGDDCDVRTFTPNDVAAYAVRRSRWRDTNHRARR